MNQAAFAMSRGARMWRARLRCFPHRVTALVGLSQAPIRSSTAVRRLLCLAALVGGVSLASGAIAGVGGELPWRGLTLAVESARALAARLAPLADDGCEAQSLLLPFPGDADESPSPVGLRLAELACDEE